MSLLFFLLALVIKILANPQLIKVSQKNQCIKSIVSTFITSSTCQQLSQNKKSKLALKMMNCLFVQMGKQEIICTNANNCDLNGDSWNTFTNFFTHIDSLCHFYWDISKAQRTQQMIDALITSASNTQQTLSKNNQNTKQILQLQSALKIQILSSIATQQQMAQIIANSSIAINSLTSDIASSLNKIHEDIDQNYAVVSRILSAVNQVLRSLDSLQLFLAAQARSLQGIIFFVVWVILISIGCLVSIRVRRRKNQLFILISMHFLSQFFFASQINSIIGIQTMRSVSLILIFIFVLTSKQQKNRIQQALEYQLNSERIGRLVERALRKQKLAQLTYKRSSKKSLTPLS